MTSTYVGLASINLVLGGLVFLLGLVILRENSHQRLNRITSAMLFLGGFGAVLSALSLVFPASAQNASSMQQSMAYVWEMFFPTMFLFASIFPGERIWTRPLQLGRVRLPPFPVLVYTPHVFHILLALLLASLPAAPHEAVPRGGALHSILQLGGVGVRLFFSVHQALFSLVDLGFGGAAVALLLTARRQQSVARLRQQLTAIAFGLTACLVLYASATSMPTLLGRPLDPALRAALTAGALTVGSGAIAYAIVRHKFLDAKLLARRGILYALATTVLVAIYLVFVERANQMIARSFGLDARVVEPVFLILALTLFQPVLARLEDWLDQMFLRDPGDYRNVLRQLGRDLQTEIDLEELMMRSVRTVSEALLLRSAHLVALTREGPVTRAGAGTALTPDQAKGLADLLPRLSRHEPSFRLSDPIDGLRRADRELLVKTLAVEILVPLRWHGDTLGALLLGEKLTATEFTSEDVALLNTLGSQMAVSLQNALLLRDRVRVARIEEELNLARQIQSTMLRADFPPMARFDIHGVNLPSRQVGGDYYDIVACDGGRFYVAIADVAGKGVPAALLSAMLQAALRTQARAAPSVAGILSNINELVLDSTAVQQFATFFLARIDTDRMRLTFSNAGHNWPLLVRRTGERKFLERGGLLLGILPNVSFEEEHLELGEGDVIVFYTDGISEATNAQGELFSDERLAEFIAALPRGLSACEISDRILRAIEQHLGAVEAQDDRTLVVMRVLAAAPERLAEQGERFEPAAARLR